MKVAAYSIKPFEKELLSKANQKKHDITLISNQLSIETTILAGVIAEHAVALAFVLNQAYLTRETLQCIAAQTIKNLDLWQQNKCMDKACACPKNCQVPAVSNQI